MFGDDANKFTTTNLDRFSTLGGEGWIKGIGNAGNVRPLSEGTGSDRVNE